MQNIEASVLVINDEAFSLLVLRDILEKQGLRVETARGGSEGIAKAKASLPSLVLLDSCRPETDCVAVCRALKDFEATKPIPVLVMRTFEKGALRHACLQAGGNELLTKPYHNSELVHRIRKLLVTPSGRRQAPPDETPGGRTD